MVERGNGGAFVMVSSVASYRACDGHAVYCGTKSAMDQLARCVAVELDPHKVNCIVVTRHSKGKKLIVLAAPS